MFAAMMEGILYLKSTKMNLKLNNTNQLVAISEPLVYKKRLQNNPQKQSLYGLSRRKRIRRNLVLLHESDREMITRTWTYAKPRRTMQGDTTRMACIAV